MSMLQAMNISLPATMKLTSSACIFLVYIRVNSIRLMSQGSKLLESTSSKTSCTDRSIGSDGTISLPASAWANSPRYRSIFSLLSPSSIIAF